MQVLTLSGYVNIEDLNIGDEVMAYDVNDGHVFLNVLENKERWTYDMLPAVYDENGFLVKTSEQVFQETYGDWKFYKINNTWTLFWGQSVWANNKVVHASELQIGDVVYNGGNSPVVITDIQETTAPEWWRLTISGDHSYIADDISLHNASRYWVGGGSSANWNATANTNWGSASGVQDNSSVPTSIDDVTFDGAGVGGNTNSTISAAITILSLNITSGYTATMTHNAALTVAGNITLGANYTIAGAIAITINAASTITSNGKTWPNDLVFDGANTKTLVGNLSITGKLFIQPSSATVINRTTTETLSISGGANFASYVSGTATLVYKGGTFTGINYNSVSSSITFDGNITIGNLYGFGGGTLKYLSGTVSFVSGIYFNNNITVDTVGMSWGGVFSNGGTYTLLSNFSAVTLGQNGNSFWNTSNGSTVTVSSQLWSQGGTGGFNGTAKFFLTGGTMYTTQTYFYLAIDVTLNGNVTIGEAGSGRICGFAGGAIRYQSGTITTTSSTLHFYGGTTILDTNGITWNNITSGNPSTITLSSNLSMTGLFTVSSATTINQSTTQTWTVSGGITVNAGLSGTAKVILTGGTWSGSSTVGIANNLDLQGNVTLSGTQQYYGGGTMTYVSGTITPLVALVIRANSTLNTNGITWGNLSISNAATITLTSNLNISQNFYIGAAIVINRTTAETVTVGNGIVVLAACSGTAKIILTGGTWSGTATLSNNLDLQGNITVSGTVLYSTNTLRYISGTVTVTGSTLRFNGNTTVNTSGITWNNISFNQTTTVTLTSNFAANGVFTIDNSATFNKSVSETITLGGGITFSAGNFISTADVIITGGTFSQSSVGTFRSNITFNGNSTISGTGVRISTSVVTYQSGTITTTGSTVTFVTSATLNTSGMTWNNITNDGAITYTLTSNLVANGSFSAGNGGICTVNRTTSETVSCNGINTQGNDIAGTAAFILTGGTWIGASGAGNGISNNVTINGNVTFGTTVRKLGGTLTYQSGTVTVTGNTFECGCGLNTNGMAFNILFVSTTGAITLTSDLTINGQLRLDGGNIGYFNRTTNENVYLNGGINNTLSANQNGGGTADLYLRGGTWTSSGFGITQNLIIDGNVNISGTVQKSGGILQYNKGKVTFLNNAILSIVLSSTIIGFNRLPLQRVSITAGQTATFDRFFIGTPEKICNIVSTGANYTIAFQDGFERVARNVAISGATAANPGQLLVINNTRFNTNRSTNSGLRYVNSLANGIPRNMPSITDTTTCPAMGLTSDPCFQTQG